MNKDIVVQVCFLEIIQICSHLTSSMPFRLHYATTEITTLTTEPTYSHLLTTNQPTTEKMLLYYFLLFLGEIIVCLLIRPLAVAVQALAFNPVLQARWNLLLMQVENVLGEYAEWTVRWILGME